HRVEAVWPPRMAEAGMRGRDDLRVSTEPIQERRPRIDVLEAVEQQHRPAGASAQHLELDAADRQDLGHRRSGGARHRPTRSNRVSIGPLYPIPGAAWWT